MADETREEIEQQLQEFIPNAQVRAGEGPVTFVEKRPDGPTICDFCATMPAPHVYAADDIVVDEDTVLGVSASAGAWGACGTCSAMIEVNDRQALLVRSAKMLHRKHGNLPYEVIKSSVARSHRAFWKARK